MVLPFWSSPGFAYLGDNIKIDLNFIINTKIELMQIAYKKLDEDKSGPAPSDPTLLTCKAKDSPTVLQFVATKNGDYSATLTAKVYFKNECRVRSIILLDRAVFWMVYTLSFQNLNLEERLQMLSFVKNIFAQHLGGKHMCLGETKESEPFVDALDKTGFINIPELSARNFLLDVKKAKLTDDVLALTTENNYGLGEHLMIGSLHDLLPEKDRIPKIAELFRRCAEEKDGIDFIRNKRELYLADGGLSCTLALSFIIYDKNIHKIKAAVFFENIWYDRKCTICVYDFIVRPNFQKQQLGRSLFAYLWEYATKNVDFVHATISEKAREYYQKFFKNAEEILSQSHFPVRCLPMPEQIPFVYRKYQEWCRQSFFKTPPKGDTTSPESADAECTGTGLRPFL